MEIACKYCGRIFKAKPSAVKKGKSIVTKNATIRRSLKARLKNALLVGKK